MLTKKEFGNLIKSNFLWPGYNWRLISTANGLEGSTNEYLDGVVEILIDTLYQKYLSSQNIVSVFDVQTTDSSKETVSLQCNNHNLTPGVKIKVYGTNFYDGEYEVLESLDDSIWIGQSYTPEILSNSAYFTRLSDDWYEESSPYPLTPGSVVAKIENPQSPTFLPLIGLDLGYPYDDRRDIAENRKLIQRAVPFYQLKGTQKSIHIVMDWLGYKCEVIEPFKDILKYGISKYDFKHHYQDWAYYHDGVFEVITDGVSLNQYQRTLRNSVQVAGTRLVGRANINLGLIPIVNEILYTHSDSIFIEAVVRAYVAGNIYDTITDPRARTRSGNLALSGIYLDLSVDIGSLQSFRRIWDTNLFSFDDVTEPITETIPANTLSVIRGAYSGQVNIITGYETPYDETTPFDLQLPISVVARSERPAIRSEYCNKRSESNSRSGLDGNNWEYKPAYILDFNDSIDMGLADYDNPIEIISNLDGGFLPYSQRFGDILDVNDSYSGIRSLYGFELAVGYREYTMRDWSDKIYWSWDDVAVRVDMSSTSLTWKDYSMDIVREPIMISTYSQEEVYSSNASLSGYFQCNDIEVLVSN